MDKPAVELPASSGEQLLREVIEKASVFSMSLITNINNINCTFLEQYMSFISVSQP